MPPAAAAAAGRLATYVLTPSVAVPLVRLPRRCGRARRFDSASYGSPLVSLGLATVSFFNNLLGEEKPHKPPEAVCEESRDSTRAHRDHLRRGDPDGRVLR